MGHLVCLCSYCSAVVVCVAVHRVDAQVRTHSNRAITDAYTIQGEGALGQILLPGPAVSICYLSPEDDTVALGFCFGLGPLFLVSSSLASHRLIMRRLPIALGPRHVAEYRYTVAGRARLVCLCCALVWRLPMISYSTYSMNKHRFELSGSY